MKKVINDLNITDINSSFIFDHDGELIEPLIFSCCICYEDFEYMIKNKADLNKKNKRNETILDILINKLNMIEKFCNTDDLIKIISLLVKNGATTTIEPNNFFVKHIIKK